jgi:membrane protein implicated in regulation of membrane protease activity
MWFESYMGYFWLFTAIFFLFIELNTPGVLFFVSFAIGSICASVLAFVGYSLTVQCLLGLAVSLIAFFIMRKFIKTKKMSEIKFESAITNIDALVGKTGVVVSTIGPMYVGQVKVGGELWRAKPDGDVLLEKGAIVYILRVEGNTVIVRPWEVAPKVTDGEEK